MADNVNISPDMIENLINTLKSNGANNNNSVGNNSEDNTDAKSNDTNSASFSEIFKNFSSNSKKNSLNSGNSSPLGNLDLETILKIKSIMEALNTTNNQDSQLLYSLKPYLRKSRQDKLDQYINILKISQVSKIFKKGDIT